MGKSQNRPFQLVGENIARLRKERGFSNQADFAHALGIGISALKDIERGVSEGHIDTRIAVTELLHCQLMDLYREPTAPAEATPTTPQPPPLAQRSSGDILLKDVARILVALAETSEVRRLIVLYMLLKDEAYIDQLRKLGLNPRAVQDLVKFA